MRILLCLLFCCVLPALPAVTATVTDTFPDVAITNRSQADVVGHVLRMHTSVAPLKLTGGKWNEGPRLLTQKIAFDGDGRNVLEAMLRPDGSALWKHVFVYNQSGLLVKALAFGAFVGKTGAKCTYYYDGKGRLTERVNYDITGIPISKLASPYDIFERPSGKLAFRASSAGWQLTARELYHYDLQGNRIEEIIENLHRGEIAGAVYTYEAGKLVREARFSSDNTTLYISYNPQGKPAELIRTRADGTMMGKTTFVYNGQGNVMEECHYDGKGTLTFKTATMYQGNQVSEVITVKGNGTLIRKITHGYDGAGRRTDITDNSPLEKTTYTSHIAYDEKDGHKLEEVDVHTDASGHVAKRRVTYAYDSHGNWIRKAICDEGGGLSQVIYRDIQYF